MRRLKVDVDLDSRSVVIKTTIEDIRNILTAAAINCYDSLDNDRKSEDSSAKNEALAYHNGLLLFINGVDELIKMQQFPRYYIDPIPRNVRSIKQRWDEIKQEKYERWLLDRIMEEALTREED